MRHTRCKRSGLTLLELLAMVTIMGILAAITVPRFSGHSASAQKNTCFVNKGNVEVQVQLWLRQQGTLPAVNLSDIGADAEYFPSGLPTCPLDGSSYQIDATTGKVIGHTHP